MNNGRNTLWYREPAHSWNESLPLGNGRLGAMVFGGITEERIALNEDTLWTGYPTFCDQPNAYGAMQEARKEEERQAQFTSFMNSPATQQRMAQDAVADKGSSPEKSVVKGAVIGGVIAGPAGAVVGAIAGQNKAEQKANASPANPAMQAVAYKKDDGTKTIIKDAIIGGAVAGPAGAVVGAVVGKNKVDQGK